MDLQRLGQRLEYAEARIELSHRIVGEQLHAAAELGQCGSAQSLQRLAIEMDIARSNSGQPQQSTRQAILAAAALAGGRNVAKKSLVRSQNRCRRKARSKKLGKR